MLIFVPIISCMAYISLPLSTTPQTSVKPPITNNSTLKNIDNVIKI